MGGNAAAALVAARQKGRGRLTSRYSHAMPFGAAPLPGGGTRFRLWAPSSPRVGLQLQCQGTETWMQHAMHSLGDGWHELALPEAGAGSRYKFVVQDRDRQPLSVPDPASRSNPDGVHGASAVVNPLDYAWVSSLWRGRSFADAVLYELHVGTFTEEGTFAACGRQLEYLKELGITALQLMPLAAFPGGRGWGYDGVLPFAPAECYGRPDELKALIDGAHALGLMVFLDVVYNHFGPEGNYLHAYCPQFFNTARQTPWGAAINFDGADSRSVRDFFVHNALYWLEEYRFDGLRLDAVHAIKDSSTPDIVQEIAHAIREGPGREREVHLVLENNANHAHYLERSPDGSPRAATAQWDDDVHHSLHVLTSCETDGYYADYAANPLEKLGRSLAEGFAYQGEYSGFRDRARGQRSRHLPPCAFVGFLQNHDMIGNRAFGDRIQVFADERLLPAAYACLLLTPQVPMLFMGEEFSASTPFMFFCDFGADLAQSVLQGRRREFKRFAAFADDAAAARIPDPNASSTFDASKLRWDERQRPPHHGRLELITTLLRLRRRHLSRHLPHMAGAGRFEVQGALLHLEWRLPDETIWRLQAHFGNQAVPANATLPADIIYSAGVSSWLEPGAVIVSHAQAAAR
jgi:maltooligosyltrehalose trehalohydrolase